MTSALIGHTGFVGANLARQFRFDSFFNSKNIEEIAGRSFDLLVVSGMPAAMWIANRDPEADRAVLDKLAGCLTQARAARVAIMSTIAVYPTPLEVDEDSAIDREAQTAYGRHRLMLEQIVTAHFPYALAVRLPGIFGPGLKKNVVFDLLHNHEVHKINAAGVYQYYDLDRLWADVSTALASGLRVVNFATEPLSVAEMAREAYGLDFANDPGGAPARFNMLSKHAGLFGGRDGYLYTRGQVLDGLRLYVQHERAGISA
jgi:nucleoside-diphosphate-sugar epimerase